MNIVIGAGVGGLAAAIALVRAGERVTVIDGRTEVGGLAGGLELNGQVHDGGPYILLDRPGLEWAFRALGADMESLLDLIRLDDEVYRVRFPDGDHVSIFDDLDRTADAFEARERGAGDAYRRWIAEMTEVYAHLSALQRQARPGAWDVVRRGLFKEGLFLMQGLATHLRRSGLPARVQDALGIWTHIAAQPLERAPAPLAFVPAVIHTWGAWIARGGMHRVVSALAELARAVGVRFRLGERVTRIVRDDRKVLGVEVGGERLDASRVISNAPGISTYVDLLHPPDPALSDELRALPLQSPGVAAWLEMDASPQVPFLQFLLPEQDGPHPWTRALLNPGAYDVGRRGQGRLICPTPWSWAEAHPAEAQRALLETLLEEPWWKEGLERHQVVGTRVPVEWGQQYLLYRDSMNPAMTAEFMRAGRIPHQSPICDNLLLAGSSTHPGQWVSFCAISGVLAATEALGASSPLATASGR